MNPHNLIIRFPELQVVYDVSKSTFESYSVVNRKKTRDGGSSTSVLDTSNKSTTVSVDVNSFQMKELCHVNAITTEQLTDVQTLPVEDKFKTAYQEVGANDSATVPWHLCLPTDVYARYAADQESKIREVFSKDKMDLSYYSNTFKATERLLTQDLYPATVDWDSITAEDEGNNSKTMNLLRSFLPHDKTNNTLKTVRYSRINTITGRLVVSEGPEILLLSKKLREKLLVSRHGRDKGSITYIDFKSLEPRVMSSVLPLYTGHPSPISYNRDIYNEILNKTEGLHSSNIPREAIKFVVIQRLYGAMNSSIVGHLTTTYPRVVSTAAASDLIGLIDSIFQIPEMKQALGNEFSSTNFSYIRNFFGRKVLCDQTYKLVNYYGQSTAVDVALLAFQKMTDWLKEEDLVEEMTPLFVLHDALVLDMTNEALRLYSEKLIRVGQQPPPGFPSDVTFFLDLTVSNH